MLAIAVEFLTTKYFSARFEDGDSKEWAEWPPHPVRLFRALTSATFDSPLQRTLEPYRAALEWLESQDPPEVHASPLAGDELPRPVGVFVPVNDRADGQKAYELLTMRARKERNFPYAVPESSVVYFVWPESRPTPEHLAGLVQMMRFVPYLGSSHSVASLYLAESIPTNLNCWRTAERGKLRLRTASSGSLADLERKAVRFNETGQKAYRPGGGRWTAYALAP